jgi:riboflavin transporter FmnP
MERSRKSLFPQRGTFEVVFAALCASLAIFMTFYKVVFAFPILPYLKFELAEIPVVIAFLVAGPFSGLLSSVIYWIILTLVGEWTPIGPAMKFLAVAPTILGLWAGFALSRRLRKNPGIAMSMSVGIVLAMVARVIVTSLMNLLVLWWLFPFFLDIAANHLKAILGFQADSSYMVLLMTLVFTAVFNIMHLFLSVIPSYYLVVKAFARVKPVGLRKIWVQRVAWEAPADKGLGQ